MASLCCESADSAEAGGGGEGAAMVSDGAGTGPDLAPIPAFSVAPRGAAGSCAQEGLRRGWGKLFLQSKFNFSQTDR